MTETVPTAELPAHSKFSASGAERWSSCPGSIVLCAGIEDKPSFYAAEGSAAHQVLEWVLETRLTTDILASGMAYEGRVLEIDGFEIEVTEDMAGYVDATADAMMIYAAHCQHRWTERRFSYGHVLGVPDAEAFGTSDFTAVDTKAGELQVHDFKYGRGVRVDPENNPQLLLYALGALAEFDLAYEFDTVRMVIHQPRIEHTAEWVITVKELTARAERLNLAARAVKAAEGVGIGDALGKYLLPSEKACSFCRAKARCPKMQELVLATVGEEASVDDFADLTVAQPAKLGGNSLAEAMSKVDMIEDWCRAVRAEIERKLVSGEQVPGYKLVTGKQGNRKWTDPAAAEARMKSARLRQDEMYAFKLQSPTQMEKALAKASPRVWADLTKLIYRAPGKPSVAPESDPRQAVTVQATADDFEDLLRIEQPLRAAGQHPFRS